MKKQWILFIGLLIACNGLFDPAALTYVPEKVLAGEWWRVWTHCFVHVSWYHLLMDAGAVALLWHGLLLPSAKKRGLLFIACLLGSAGVATLTSPLDSGLCGLSGIAHGLMIFSGLEYAIHPDAALRRCGWICVTVVALKSGWEAYTGTVLFAGLHFGEIANPIATCHAGGTLGALVAWLLFQRSNAPRPPVWITTNKKPARKVPTAQINSRATP